MTRFIAILIPLGLLAGFNEAAAQADFYCESAQERYDDAYRRSRPQPVRATTQTVLDGIDEALLANTLDDPVAARDRILDREPPVVTRDQHLVVRRMEVVYCRILFSGDNVDAGATMDRFNRIVTEVSSAEPFDPAATTRETRQAFRHGNPLRPNAMRAALAYTAFSPSGNVSLSIAETRQEPEEEFLAEAPYFVNRTNKYFVIIASASSLEEGEQWMRELKEIAPEYDFAVYAPYRGNRNYAVMFATWVSKDVAGKAHKASIQVARRWLGEEFSPRRDTPFLWCYPDGSCG